MDKLNKLVEMQTGFINKVIENHGHDNYIGYVARIKELASIPDKDESEVLEFEHLKKEVSKWINQELTCIASECDEIRRTTIWKHWKKEQDFNLTECKEEAIDLLHFTLELLILLDMDADEIFKMYCDKNGINHERQETGY